MEIKINIEPNRYVQPTEVRPEIVQGICDAFLRRCSWSTFHSEYDGRGRQVTKRLLVDRNGKFYGFTDEGSLLKDNDYGVDIRGVEMKTAFKVLIKAGYHMFREYTYGSWKGYFVSDKPYVQGATEVYEFNDFID